MFLRLRLAPFVRRVFAASLAAAVSLAASASGALIDPAAAVVEVRSEAGALERFAGRELQRLIYLRTGRVPAVATAGEGPAAPSARFRLVIAPPGGDGEAALRPGDYRIAVEAESSPAEVTITGGDPLGVLAGVYRTAERFGARFYLHADVVPEGGGELAIEAGQETGRPLFSVRGLQPFHDFAEGPDWWNRDDYLAVLGQMAKLRMNFLGLHTYPESQVGPEPTVWIGREEEMTSTGEVRMAYPASYHTTGRAGRTWWGYDPVATSTFTGGAAALFERDDFGAEVMRDLPFTAQTPETAAVVFNRTGDLLGAAFAHARRLGILTCVGTETPLTLPEALVERLRADGRDPDDPALARELYRAMFERIRRAYPVDYYWLWTPENWTWEGNRSEQYAATEADLRAALAALEDLGHPMTLATCGWVLGPQHDRAALDRLLPPDSPMSAINSAVGHTPIERQFANLSERPRWAIPWLENDGTITVPQLWTGRMRYDAVDARRLGCTGLIGIHWRTKILAPAISALAAAAWDQSWIPDGFDASPIPPLTASGATGGRAMAAADPGGDPADPRAERWRTARVGMPSYDLLVPAGEYRLRLGFSEVEGATGREFDVKVQGELRAAGVRPSRRGEVVELAGLRLTEARLLLEFVAREGEPAIAFIEIEGVTDVGRVPYVRRINCGGPALAGFEADQLSAQPRPPIDRSMPVGDFYRDFAMINFGPEAAEDIAAIFTAIDGVNLPAPNHWIDGPGDIRRNREPWTKVAPAYAFVAEFEALQGRIRGAANRERYAYWVHQFRAMRTMAELGCAAGALDALMEELAALDAAPLRRERAEQAAVPLRRRMTTLWNRLLQDHVASASTTGELGGIANLEQRTRVHHRFLERHDAQLAGWLGGAVPVDEPGRTYAGPARIIVPTVRTAAAPGERLSVRVRFAGSGEPAEPVLRWRWLGETGYRVEPLRPVARAVFDAELPALDAAHPAMEYQIEAGLDGTAIRWPASDVDRGHVVVLWEDA